MARIKEWMDLAELGDLAQWVAYGGGASTFGLGGRVLVTAEPYRDPQGNGGNYNLRFQDPTAGLILPWLSTPVSTFYARFHFKTSNINYDSGGGGRVFEWRKNTTTLGTIELDSSGRIFIRTGGVILGTSVVPVVAVNTWVTIEVKIVIGNSGSYEIRVNGVPVLTGSGDTQPGSDTDVNNIIFQVVASFTFGGGILHYFDDIAVDTATWCGEGLITALKPNEAGTTTQLVPTGSSDNWRNVDEIPPLDTDYNSTTTPNKKDTYVHESLPGAASTVKSVLTVARIARTGSDIASAYLVTRSGTTDYEDAVHPVGITAGIISKLEEIDPDTGIAWTPGGVNLTELGIRFDT